VAAGEKEDGERSVGSGELGDLAEEGDERRGVPIDLKICLQDGSPQQGVGGRGGGKFFAGGHGGIV